MNSTSPITRRRFVFNSAAAAAAVVVAPRVLTAQKSSPRQLVVGEGGHRYEITHDWAQLPSRYSWQTTHNVAVDREGLLYVIHEGRENLPDHPSIFVFDEKGKFVRAFGSQFQGGGHGLEVVTEGGEQFLYVTGYQHLKNFAKLTLTGELVWEKRAPMQSGLYPAGEDTAPVKRWGRDAFMPTNYAFLPDGGFFLADGYGAYRIHRYDKNGKWLSMFGAPGEGAGEFNTPHGLALDDRPGREPSLVVADRANKRLQWFTLDGKHLETLEGFILPANLDTRGDLLLVPDLSARITLLDGNNRIVAHLGEDPAWREKVTKDKNALRKDESGASWAPGKFLHPHDACFDASGNIFVAEWVHTGRISKLRKLS
ncbi:MAG: twin-arginine translocation signal domain-containing protein [Opitutaceae bacterium]